MGKCHDSVMTIDEFSVYLKVAKSTLHKLSQKGEFPGQKVARHRRFHRDTVYGWFGNVSRTGSQHQKVED